MRGPRTSVERGRYLGSASCLLVIVSSYTIAASASPTEYGEERIIASEEEMNSTFSKDDATRFHPNNDASTGRQAKALFGIQYHSLQKAMNPLQNLVTFPTSTCQTSDGNSGVCYKAMDCRRLGGKPLGTCAHGFGVCCLVLQSCRNSTSQLVSYFTNPSYPNQDTTNSICDFDVDIVDSSVCQIRLDFVEFEIGGVEDGDCVTSMILIRGTNVFSDVEKTCGSLTGQHMYLTADPTAGKTFLTLMVLAGTGAATVQPFKWLIRVTQIDCQNDYKLRAPDGCLQYFPESTGSFSTFNYPAGTTYLANMDYAICIRRPPNARSVTYTDVDGLFSLEADLPTSQGGACQRDYLLIPQVLINPPLQGFSTIDRFCANFLSSAFDPTGATQPTQSVPISANLGGGPIVIQFHSSTARKIPGGLTLRGFNISYSFSGTIIVP